MQLSQKKCVACEGGIPPMEKEKAEDFLKQVQEWSLAENNKKISKNFEFRNFEEAMVFINLVAALAEEEQHHPDIFVSYNKVRIDIWTHKINGLHENDFILAAKIDELQ